MDQDYDDASDEQTESPGKGLRAQLEAALAEKKSLESEVSKLRDKARQSEVSQVLSAKGVNSKIAKFIPADVEGEEAIAKWLDDNADVFGVSIQSDEGEPTPAPGPNVPPGTVDAANRMQQLGQSAQAPTQLTDLQERMRNANTAEELQELWAEAQKFML